jgi:hypothetical protein
MEKASRIVIFILFVGLFLAVNQAKAAVSYANDFSVVNLSSYKAPSKWIIKNGLLYQASDIGNGDGYDSKDFFGSFALYKNFFGSSFDLKASFKSGDNDGVGIVFGYQNKSNFYQFIVTKEIERAVLARVANGESEIIKETDNTYAQNNWQTLRVYSQNGLVSIYLNNSLIITTQFNQVGQVGLAVWANRDVYFDNFFLTPLVNDDVVVAGAEYEEPASSDASASVEATADMSASVEATANASMADFTGDTDNEQATAGEGPLLFRTDTSSAVYAIFDGKRHKILNEEVFSDYGFDWDEVKTVSAQTLQQYPHAKVVKSADDSKVYYIAEEINKKKHIPTEAIFLAYGNQWEDIVTISQKDLDSYSDVRVVKTANSSTVYELIDGVKQAIVSPEEFVAAGYQWGEIVTIKQVELDYYATKMIIGGEEVVVAGVEYEEGDEPADGVGGDVLTVTGNRYLSVKTIKKGEEITIPGGSFVTMLQLRLTAGLEQPVSVSAIKVTRSAGVSAIDKLIIADAQGNVLGQKDFTDDVKVTILLNPILYIAPNTSQIIDIKAATIEPAVIAYDELSIETEADIATDGYIEGSFPITGDRFKTISGSNLIGQLQVEAVIVSDGLRSAYMGATDVLITKFTFTETTGNEDVYLKKLKIRQTGSRYVEIANIDLVDQNNKIIATVLEPDDRDIIFDMSVAPYKIKKGTTQTFSIRTDIVGGPGSDIKFVIQKNNDILASGATYLFDILAVDNDSYPLGRGTGSYTNTVRINDANVLVYKNSASPVGDLTANSQSQVLGVFDVRMGGIALVYKGVTLQIINGGDINLDGDIEIRNYKTKEVIGRTYASLVSNQPTTINLDKLIEIAPQQTYTFEVVANVDKDATILDTYQVKINSLDFQIPNNGQAYHFNYQLYSNALGVKRAHLAITDNSDYYDKDVAADKDDVLIGSFKLQAGVAENLVIDAFSIQEAANYTIMNYSEGYSNLRIKIGRTEYARYSAPNGGPYIASKPFTIKAGQTAIVAVYVDTTPAVDADEIKLTINNVTVHGQNSGLVPSQTGDATASFVTTFKQNRLVIAKATAMEDTTIRAGQGKQQIAMFSFKNTGAENIKVSGFTLEETDTSAEISYNNDYAYLVASPGGTVKYPIAKGNKFGSFTVAAGTTTILNVYINPGDSAVNDEFSLILKDIIVDGGVEVDGESIVGQSIRVVPGP